MPPFGVQQRQRAVVRGQEFACPVHEGCALRGKPHVPRRPFDQLMAQAVFQAFEPDADRALGRAQGVRRFREASKFRDAHEGLDGVHLQRRLGHHLSEIVVSDISKHSIVE
ncbi:hypothetical protein G6F63_015834 [Rhizopus arrhizus]|nr:hypothetical protein G6F63_015834 [Rhizopus arrhizus]